MAYGIMYLCALIMFGGVSLRVRIVVSEIYDRYVYVIDSVMIEFVFNSNVIFKSTELRLFFS